MLSFRATLPDTASASGTDSDINPQWLVSEGPARVEALRFLRFWLDSIVVHARGRHDASLPPIVLVGTHRDKVMAWKAPGFLIMTNPPLNVYLVTCSVFQ